MINKFKRSFCSINRDYFFFIDHKGYLYLEESEPKIYPNAIKDKKFLKHFY